MNDKPMTVDVLEAIAREVGQMERRHCIGRAQGFDIRDGYAELRAAIEQYGREREAAVRDAIAAWLHGQGQPGYSTEVQCGAWGSLTAPQSREPLTDDQLQSVMCSHFGEHELTDDEKGSAEAFARAIERAHGIRSAGWAFQSN